MNNRSRGPRGSRMSQIESFGQNPVGFFPVQATTASGRADSVSSSASATLAVRLAVAITTHSSANSVTQSAFRTLMGTAFTRCASFRATAGATSTLADTANTGAAQGMCVRNGRRESAHLEAPVVSTRLRRARSQTRQPLRRR